MTLPCEETSESLAAFALDALANEERLAVLEHLAECREHDEELAVYRNVAGVLPLALEEQAPPAGLRSSLLQAFDAESAATTRVAAPLTHRPRAATRPRSGIFEVLRRPMTAYGIAAALLIAVIGLAAINLTSNDNTGQIVLATTTTDGISLRVVYLPGEEVAVLDVDLPELTGGQVYQAWQISGSQPISLGLLAHNKGATAFSADLRRASAVAISVEPPGGSQTPTTSPVVVSEF